MKAHTSARIKLNAQLKRQQANAADNARRRREEDDWWNGQDDSDDSGDNDEDEDEDSFDHISRGEKLRYLYTDAIALRTRIVDLEGAVKSRRFWSAVQGGAIVLLGLAIIVVVMKC